MTTISEFKDNFPFLAVTTMLNQVKEKLGDEFYYEINKENKTVLISKVPDQYKENIFESISKVGFVPIMK